jgi:hypothetical protein
MVIWLSVITKLSVKFLKRLRLLTLNLILLSKLSSISQITSEKTYNSEFAICENLIYPVLKEVWKCYRSKFILWSHQSLNYDEKLSGFPEYILAKKSSLGKVVFDKPYFILVEAKQDNFEAGWAQCLAEMIAAQRLNQEACITIYGIVSNGEFWQFGKLDDKLFTKNIAPYTIYELDKLFAAVNHIFQQCELQLDNLVAV